MRWSVKRCFVKRLRRKRDWMKRGFCHRPFRAILQVRWMYSLHWLATRRGLAVSGRARGVPMRLMVGLVMAFAAAAADAQEAKIRNIRYSSWESGERAIIITVETDKDLIECIGYKVGVPVVSSNGSATARIARVTLQ